MLNSKFNSGLTKREFKPELSSDIRKDSFVADERRLSNRIQTTPIFPLKIGDVFDGCGDPILTLTNFAFVQADGTVFNPYCDSGECASLLI